MKDSLSRRDFFKGIGAGTIGSGFGVSLFDGMSRCLLKPAVRCYTYYKAVQETFFDLL